MGGGGRGQHVEEVEVTPREAPWLIFPRSEGRRAPCPLGGVGSRWHSHGSRLARRSGCAQGARWPGSSDPRAHQQRRRPREQRPGATRACTGIFVGASTAVSDATAAPREAAAPTRPQQASRKIATRWPTTENPTYPHPTNGADGRSRQGIGYKLVRVPRGAGIPLATLRRRTPEEDVKRWPDCMAETSILNRIAMCCRGPCNVVMASRGWQRIAFKVDRCIF